MAKLLASNLMMHPDAGDCKSKRSRIRRWGSPGPTTATMGAMARGMWTDSVTPIAPPTAANPGVRTVAYAALVTGVWAGLLSVVVYGVAQLLRVPMTAETLGGMQSIPWFAVLLLPVIAAQIGGLASLPLIGRRAAGRIVFWAGTIVAVLSLVPLVLQPTNVLISTRIWLGVMHVITWILVVPQIARIVGDSEPGKHEDREVG